MPGMQFEYDEKGGTFYYFLLSFFALILFPATFYLWPTKSGKEDVDKKKRQCLCEKCQMKRQLLKASEPWVNTKRRALKGGLLLGWILFLLLAYKVSQIEIDFTEYDPYVELEIDRGASSGEIKKAYRHLSLQHHPDRGGDPKKFMRIAKAYAALTDEESRENWEKFGNPDGPSATHFGIALPKWIVEKQNSLWVLAVYGLVFIIILPIVVGSWWYRSIKFSGDQILLDTTQIYYYFIHKTPNMIIKRVIMLLGASMEFEKGHNSEIVERPSDNETLPLLMKDLPHLNEKNKERPLCFPYSVKARAMIHAHFSRLELPAKTLEIDKQYILKKCPYLINEMVNIGAQIVALAHAGRVSHMPRLDTIENCMKVSQMVIQALWENKSALLQLPHIGEDTLKHFVTRRRNIKSIKQFVSMKDEERRSLLRSLSDDQYRDIINVCASMPLIEMQVSSEVLDDEDSTVTAGSIVTVTVLLKRQPLEVMFQDNSCLFEEEEGEDDSKQEDIEDEKEPSQNETELESPVKKTTKVWEKQKKKKGKGGKVNKKKPAKQPYQRKTVVPTAVTKTDGADNETKSTEVETLKPKRSPEEDDSDSEAGSDDDQSSTEGNGSVKSDSGKTEVDDDDWHKFQAEAKKENALEAKSKESHSVHCPYFPADKQEWWWVYVADKKRHLLVSAPLLIPNLKVEEEVQLKFSAPLKPGLYIYSVILRSDSYVDFDQYHQIKLDVKEAKKVETHPQWETISDDEEEKAEDDGSDSGASLHYSDSDED